MGWFRGHKGFGGRLALFALALQSYLAFGYNHPEDMYGPAQITLRAGIKIVVPAVEVFRASPADRTLGHTSEPCPIREARYFLGTAFTPEPLITPLPLAWRPVEPLVPIAAAAVEARRMPFQSRAPPAA